MNLNLKYWKEAGISKRLKTGGAFIEVGGILWKQF